MAQPMHRDMARSCGHNAPGEKGVGWLWGLRHTAGKTDVLTTKTQGPSSSHGAQESLLSRSSTGWSTLSLGQEGLEAG